MNRHLFIIFILILLFPFSFLFSQEKGNISSNPYILVLSSYNPDNYRTANFIKDLERHFDERGHNERIFIEDLGYSNIYTISEWKEKMQKLLKKYDDDNLRAILVLGQEAWCAYLNQDSLCRDVPLFVSFASDNVLRLPCKQNDTDYSFFSVRNDCTQVNMGGGFINEYDIEANIKLIKHIYPDVSNVAFISDNSYGGVVLQTLVKQEMKEKFPEIDLTLLDCRFEGVNSIKHRITNLSQNSVILIGTWRINNNGLYLSKHTLRDLITKDNPNPVFSLTGLGISDVAIGGYVPDYKFDVEMIADNLIKCFETSYVSPEIIPTRNVYHFNKSNLKKFGIREYVLPSEKIMEDQLEGKIKKYQEYITIILIVMMLLCALFIRYIITERKLKLKQEELIIALEKAEQSEKLKTAFLANMSHEIRTPLNAIVGFSDLMMYSEDNDEKKRYGDIISNNNILLLNIINDLLDLSKIEAGSLDFHLETIKLNDLFIKVYNSFQIRINDKTDFIIETPDKSAMIFMDPKRLTQILSNYLSNAVKFTEKGKITLGYYECDGGVYMYVKDTGIGIAEENHKKVFNRFQKFDNFAQGSGLGLSICEALAEAVNGKTGFESQVGKGSKFWCWLPYNTATGNSVRFIKNKNVVTGEA